MQCGQKCDFNKQIQEEVLDNAVVEVIIKLVSNPKFAAMMYDEFNYDASDGMLQGYWSANYSLIHKVNTLLESMKAGNLTDGNLVNKAEALFFRAYCYFNLVRAFGEVPLIDFKINQSSDANIPKSSVNDIYALIDRDLTEAEKYLPRTWESKYIGRLTWGAARFLSRTNRRHRLRHHHYFRHPFPFFRTEHECMSPKD